MGNLTRLYDGQGRTIHLARRIGQGGQATVFEVQDAPHLAAKWYNDRNQPSQDQALKLTGMAQGSDPALTSISAWPITTLHKSPSGPVGGFMMPKMSGYHPIHMLYSPMNRKLLLPQADWAFLVHAARNVASAIAAIHARGHVVGDINQNNVLVAKNATVKLIDCDSFQMQVNGRTFFCDVGVPEFTPPELHGKTFAGFTRTTNHDAFGLAVMIFHLLFMGRHPFAGRFLGKGDKPIEEAIKEFRFAFGQGAASRQMALPPHSLSLLHTSVDLAVLFERAFSDLAARVSKRPIAQEWVTTLDKFRSELMTCPAASAHKFYRSLKECPWCEIRRNAGPDFFTSISKVRTNASCGIAFDLAQTWAAIRAVSFPDTSPLIIPPVSTWASQPTPLPSYLGFTRKQALYLRGGTFAVAAATVMGLPLAFSITLTLGLLFIHYYVAPNNQERRRRRAEIKAIEKSIRANQEEWSSRGSSFKWQFQSKLKELDTSKSEYELLYSAKKQELERLKQRREAEQCKDFLEQHFLKNYDIDGIGRGRRATLLSYGIETLYDVTQRAIDQVPGFGPALTSTLLTLRSTVESHFRFDPTKGVNPAAVAGIDHEYAPKLLPLERRLRAGPQELAIIQSTAKQHRTKSTARATELMRGLARAEASALVTEKDKWQFIITIVLVLGFLFRFVVSGIHNPPLLQNYLGLQTNEVVETPGECSGC